MGEKKQGIGKGYREGYELTERGKGFNKKNAE